LKQAWHEELEHLRSKSQIESGVLKSSRKLLQSEPAKLAAPQQQQLSAVLEHSKPLKTMHDMRTELAAIWDRSHASREQLLQQLQDWCARAEASGIKALQEFSLRLRSYA
jgi:stearoyl-CoA desaturase (delta-9 desaturase)